MTTMTETATATTRILDALHGGESLTLGEIARITGDRCDALRSALDSLASVESALVKREGTTKRARIFRTTDTYRLQNEARLSGLAEHGTREALLDLSRAVLRSTAILFGVEGLKVKSTKSTIADAILAKREEIGFHECACGEPVDTAGETCTVCEEEVETPAPRARNTRTRTTVGTGKMRKANVDLTQHIAEDEIDSILARVRLSKSARAGQRVAADILSGLHPERFIDAEVLRTVLRRADRLSAPNFTVNMKKDGYVAVRDGRSLKGWEGK